MADKKIQFEIFSKGWSIASKHVDAVTKSLEHLQKVGVDVSNLPLFKGKGIAGSSTGIEKLNTEILKTQKHMKGLSGHAQDWLKHSTNKRQLDFLKDLRREYKKLTDEIEKAARGRSKLSKAEQESLSTARAAVGQQMDAVQLQRMPGIKGAYGRFMQGRVGQAMQSPMGRLGLGVGAGAALIGGASKVGGAFEERAQTIYGAQTAVTSIYTDRVIEAMQGQAHKEILFRNMGLNKEAEKRAHNLTRLQMVRDRMPVTGYMGLASVEQAKTSTGSALDIAVTGGLGLGAGLLLAGGIAAAPFTGGLSLGAIGLMGAGGAIGAVGLRGLTRPRKQTAQEYFTQNYNQQRELLKKRAAIPNYTMDRAIANSSHYGNLQRLAGIDIYGGAESGVRGVRGASLLAGFNENQVDEAMVNMMQTGGARSLISPGRNRITEALQFARTKGVENAPQFFSQLRMTTGGAERRQMIELLATGVSKGIADVDVKLEREAYTEAVMSAVNRIGRGADISQGLTRSLGISMGAMLPQNFNMLDVELAGQALNFGGVKDPKYKGLGMVSALSMFSKFKPTGKGPLGTTGRGGGLMQMVRANRLSEIALTQPERLFAAEPDEELLMLMQEGGGQKALMDAPKELRGFGRKVIESLFITMPKSMNLDKMTKNILSGTADPSDETNLALLLRSEQTGVGDFKGMDVKLARKHVRRFAGLYQRENMTNKEFQKFIDVANQDLLSPNQIQHLYQAQQGASAEASGQLQAEHQGLIKDVLRDAKPAAGNFAQQLAGNIGNLDMISQGVTTNLNAATAALRNLGIAAGEIPGAKREGAIDLPEIESIEASESGGHQVD